MLQRQIIQISARRKYRNLRSTRLSCGTNFLKIMKIKICSNFIFIFCSKTFSSQNNVIKDLDNSKYNLSSLADLPPLTSPISSSKNSTSPVNKSSKQISKLKAMLKGISQICKEHFSVVSRILLEITYCLQIAQLVIRQTRLLQVIMNSLRNSSKVQKTI